MIISRDDLKQILSEVDFRLSEPAELLLVGGGALLVLCLDATATRDLNAFPTESQALLEQAFLGVRLGKRAEAIDFNTRSAAFESYLPEDWQGRILLSEEFSTRRLRVFTPCPEDLAVMKVFRFAAKDAEDIRRLAELDSFDRDRFLEGFLEVLPVAIGQPRWHAQSFSLVWNRLYPDRALTTEDLLERAGTV